MGGRSVTGRRPGRPRGSRAGAGGARSGVTWSGTCRAREPGGGPGQARGPVPEGLQRPCRCRSAAAADLLDSGHRALRLQGRLTDEVPVIADWMAVQMACETFG